MNPTDLSDPQNRSQPCCGWSLSNSFPEFSFCSVEDAGVIKWHYDWQDIDCESYFFPTGAAMFLRSHKWTLHVCPAKSQQTAKLGTPGTHWFSHCPTIFLWSSSSSSPKRNFQWKQAQLSCHRKTTQQAAKEAQRLTKTLIWSSYLLKQIITNYLCGEDQSTR